VPQESPPRPELLALLDAVKDHPDDDTPRLILADWLDEQGTPLDAERAQIIREDIAAHRLDPHGLWLANQRLTEADHARRCDLLNRWLGPLAECGAVWLERGLPLLRIKGQSLLKPDLHPVFDGEAFVFVQSVTLTGVGGYRAEKLAELPILRRFPGLSLSPFSGFGSDVSVKLLGSANLSGLRTLSLTTSRIGVAGATALANNPALVRLRKLELRRNKLVDKAVVAIASSPHLARLERLDLYQNLIGDTGAFALAAATAFPALRQLDLRVNPRLTDRGRDALRTAFGERVKVG
jgi:uncharacterized protein (TIGR02996 family)